MPTSVAPLFLVLTITSYERDEAAEHLLVSSLLVLYFTLFQKVPHETLTM